MNYSGQEGYDHRACWIQTFKTANPELSFKIGLDHILVFVLNGSFCDLMSNTTKRLTK